MTLGIILFYVYLKLHTMHTSICIHTSTCIWYIHILKEVVYISHWHSHPFSTRTKDKIKKQNTNIYLEQGVSYEKICQDSSSTFKNNIYYSLSLASQMLQMKP